MQLCCSASITAKVLDVNCDLNRSSAWSLGGFRNCEGGSYGRVWMKSIAAGVAGGDIQGNF
jgi:hypothetical protein